MYMLRTTLRYGLIIFLGFTGYFLLMNALGLGDNPNLRFFNVVIQLTVLWFALQDWARSHPNSLHEYPAGVTHGLVTSMVGIIPFAIFMSIFLGMNPGLLEALRSRFAMGDSLTPVTIAAFIPMEGIATAVIGSYIFVRILERRQMQHE
jgi:hypothetical protein